jgi:putative nucleotide binding protein
MSDAEESGTAEDAAEEEVEYAVVLDHLPYGRPDDDRPQHQKPEIAYAVGEQEFDLFDLTLVDGADVSIGDRIVVAPDADRELVQRYREIGHDDLSRGAEQELDYVIEEIVERHPDRFLEYFNEAQPLTLRLHQLNVLPGIGEKLRDDILESRKREGPFESFEELEERISGLHDAKGTVVERIIEELTEDVKYRAFVGEEQ